MSFGENDFRQIHVLSSILTEKIRKFGWLDLDPTLEVSFQKAIIQISGVSIFFIFC